MKTGTLVKFSAPTPDEKNLVFIVIENRGNRMLVELVCNMAIKPTFVYPKSELETI